ncbi:MAG: MXAN_6640 family putative metalloprotease [Gaiellaceae bacterium]
MRPPRSPVRSLGLTACLGALLLAFAPPAWAQEEERPLPPPVPVADDALAAALETGELTEAEYTLERARSVFQLTRVRREFGDVARPSAHDATLILRDLAARMNELGGAEQGTAERILARPGSGEVPIGNGWGTVPESPSSPLCAENVCVHWVDDPGSSDAPPPLDVDPADGIPDWVKLTVGTWREVWLQEIDALGYRAPLSDETSPNGGTQKLDVYLDDLGSLGYFGYCTSDDPAAEDPDVYAVSAFCVIDNDFAQSQYGDEHSSQEFLEVTSAHEFHHASQFAYDWGEDAWLMEGTAADVEETVYPGVNDNVFFLRLWSPLTRPSSSLDRGGFGDSEYGSWIFWRYLQEKIGGDVSIVREIWERADANDPTAARGDEPPDDYSLEAVRHELSERGLGFGSVFAGFATTNRLRDYADAAAAGYPSPGLTMSYVVGRRDPTTRWRSWRINHLAARYFSFRPRADVPANARLRVLTRLPGYGAATLIVVNADGSTSSRRLERKAGGYARGTTPFGHGKIKRIEVAFSNGSTRMTSCWTSPGPPAYSCAGRPRDDGRVFELRARLLR